MHYMYCVLYFYYYYISFTSDHQTLDFRGWGPLEKVKASYHILRPPHGSQDFFTVLDSGHPLGRAGPAGWFNLDAGCTHGRK